MSEPKKLWSVDIRVEYTVDVWAASEEEAEELAVDEPEPHTSDIEVLEVRVASPAKQARRDETNP